MEKTEDQVYTNYRRIVVTPHWCAGDPLDWWHREAGIGIAHFAHDGAVGHFNLAWWLLARSTPPKDAKVYVNTPLAWVVMTAPFVMLTPRYSMTAAASFLTLKEWCEVMSKMDMSKYPQMQAHGVTHDMLRHLAERPYGQAP